MTNGKNVQRLATAMAAARSHPCANRRTATHCASSTPAHRAAGAGASERSRRGVR